MTFKNVTTHKELLELLPDKADRLFTDIKANAGDKRITTVMRGSDGGVIVYHYLPEGPAIVVEHITGDVDDLLDEVRRRHYLNHGVLPAIFLSDQHPHCTELPGGMYTDEISLPRDVLLRTLVARREQLEDVSFVWTPDFCRLVRDVLMGPDNY